MNQEITLHHFIQWLQRYGEYIDAKEAYLSELDAAIGDADHGANMARGMEKVCERLTEEATAYPNVSTLMRNVAMTLISSVGGAAGPLYGAFFLRAAKDLQGDLTALDPTQLAQLFRAGLEGVQQRGKAGLEEKTMIDTLAPAVAALEQAVAAGESIEVALHAACTAAEAGMTHTIMLQASKGRASYLGSRSIGHQDPGATSAYYLFLAAQEAWGQDGR
ncbi:MAG: dihydroxyacetone kinase subunit L [Caldilineaceae bacterium]|nr:dihydroxyacetone kinase subunit L [Caldilineaceae bacterium]